MSEEEPPCDLSPITTQGRFLLRDNQRFIVRGLVYQPREKLPPFTSGSPRDPLRDERLIHLKRDIVLFRELGINALRTYVFEVDQPHDQSMRELMRAGIYVVMDLSDPRNAINRMNPRESYNSNLLDHFSAKLDAMSKFANVLGVSVANEIVNDGAHPDTAAVIRDMIRDMKVHMSKMNQIRGQRVLPLCINDGCDAARSVESFNFFTTPAILDNSIDFYMQVNYDSVYNSESKWKVLASRYQHASIPLIISEYGCNLIRPRLFEEVDTLYSTDYLKSFSGGFAYDYEEGPNQYGLVKSAGEEQIERLPDFHNLRAKMQSNPLVTPPEGSVPD